MWWTMGRRNVKWALSWPRACPDLENMCVASLIWQSIVSLRVNGPIRVLTDTRRFGITYSIKELQRVRLKMSFFFFFEIILLQKGAGSVSLYHNGVLQLSWNGISHFGVWALGQVKWPDGSFYEGPVDHFAIFLASRKSNRLYSVSVNPFITPKITKVRGKSDPPSPLLSKNIFIIVKGAT